MVFLTPLRSPHILQSGKHGDRQISLAIPTAPIAPLLLHIQQQLAAIRHKDWFFLLYATTTFSDRHDGQTTLSPILSNLFPQSLHSYRVTSIFSISILKSPPPALHISITSYSSTHKLGITIVIYKVSYKTCTINRSKHYCISINKRR